MENAHLPEQDNSYAATLALADFCLEFTEQCFNVLPLDIAAGRGGENQFERALVLPLHGLQWYHEWVLKLASFLCDG